MVNRQAMVVSVDCWVADRGLSFFSSSETVLTAASDARMRKLANKGNKRAKIVEKLRALGWQLTDEDASTLAGLLLVESRTIPSSGQEFRFHDIRFRTVKRKGKTLKTIRVTKAKN